MEYLEQQQIEPQIGESVNIEKENADFINDIEKLQKTELANLQKFSDENKTRPVYLKEFVLIEPGLLSDIDKQAFKKFQEFMEKKENFNSAEELDEFMDYFKGYRLKCDKGALKAEALRGVGKDDRTIEEIKEEIKKIDSWEDVPENSRFFMDYIVNRVQGEYYSIVNKELD